MSSYSKNITIPEEIVIGDTLPDTNSLTSSITATYNGGQTTQLVGSWTVTDNAGNVISDPTSILLEDGKSYVYTVTFDGTGDDLKFNSSTYVSAFELPGNGESKLFSLAAPLGEGIISGDGRKISYSYILSSKSGINLQIGANANQTMKIYLGDTSASALDVEDLDVMTATGANNAITACSNAIKIVSVQRSALGAYQNRLEHVILNLDNTAENLQEAESRIRDTNMAKDMVAYAANNIIMSATQSILAHAISQSEDILSLLQ